MNLSICKLPEFIYSFNCTIEDHGDRYNCMRISPERDGSLCIGAGYQIAELHILTAREIRIDIWHSLLLKVRTNVPAVYIHSRQMMKQIVNADYLDNIFCVNGTVMMIKGEDEDKRLRYRKN